MKNKGILSDCYFQDNMVAWLKQIANPPNFVDEEKNRTAQLLYYLLFILIGSITAILFNTLLLGNPMTIYALIGMNLTLLIPLWLTRRGHVEWAGLMVIFTLLTVVTYILQGAAGLHDVGVVVYPPVVVFASLLLNRRHFLLSIFLAMAAIGWLAFGEWQKLFIPVTYLRETLPADFFTVCIVLGTTAIVSRTMAMSLVRNLVQARQEIAERQRVEAEYRLLFESSPQGIVIIDRQGHIDMANRVACQMLGYQLEEMRGKAGLFLLDPVELTQKPVAADRLQAGEIVNEERVLLRKDGGKFSVIGSTQLMPDGRFQYIFHDITLRKQLDKALEDRTEQLTRLNSISRAISTLQNLDKVFESIFEQVRASMATDAFIVCLYNLETNELSYPFSYDSGQRVNEPTTLKRPGTLFDQVITIGEPILVNRSAEEVARRNDELTAGKSNYLGIQRASASAMYAPMIAQSRVIGLLSVQSYILNAFNETNLSFLGGVALQAAIAIENARLFETLQKELEERQSLIRELEAKNTELERFTYTVSHDLKSPLVTIKGFLGFLEKDMTLGRQDRVMGDIQRIRDATDKMQLLLTDLLELSRIGRLMNPPQLVPMTSIVQEALMAVHGRISARSIRVKIANNLPNVYGDRARLVEVVQNLVDNAAKYMGNQPEPQITIGVKKQGEEKVFFVQDNGIGIASPYHGKIFDLFSKIDPKSEGTGIGLTLVKRIVEIHNGRIWVESEPGKGATIYFTLP